MTADNLWTARELSIQCGLISRTDAFKPNVCMEGVDFKAACGGIRRFYDNKTGARIDSVEKKPAFDRIMEHLRVLARTSPDVRYLITAGTKQD